MQLVNNTEKESFDLNVSAQETRITPKQKKWRKASHFSWYYFGLVSELGFIVALPIGGGAILGSVIDKSRGTFPSATLLFLFLGFVLAGINFYRIIIEIIHKR